MNNYYYDTQPRPEPSRGQIWMRAAVRMWDQMKNRRGLVFGLILVVALAAFEVFNFSTTDFALTDLLGDLKFAGLRWATILAIAFCGIDFAGLARLFTPERGANGHTAETWYLIAAWFLGATMNAMMTWWAVSLAMVSGAHQIGNEILSREQLLAYVPVFVAALVWITRILIIGTFSVAGDRLFTQAEAVLMQVRHEVQSQSAAQAVRPGPAPAAPAPAYTQRPATAPAPRPASAAKVIGGRYEDDADEPVYIPVEPRPRPTVTAPPSAASIRPADPRSATRPAPKPQPIPARNGENGHNNGSSRF